MSQNRREEGDRQQAQQEGDSPIFAGAKIGTVPAKIGTVPAKIVTVPAKIVTVPAKIGTVPAKIGTVPAKIGTVPLDPLVPSRLDPEPVPRRDFLGLGAMAAAVGAFCLATIGMIRLPKAAVLSSPSKKFRVTLPESLAAGQPYVPPGRSVALFRDEEGVYAISMICTHLGCIIKPATEGFECPCHGSRFTFTGSVTRGPAPSALPWRKVTAGGGSYVVDEGVNVPAGTKV